MSATLVASVPLPAQQAPAENVLANESKGLSQSEPKEEPKVEEPTAIPIPEQNAKRKNDRRDLFRRKQPKQVAKVQQDNQIPYGRRRSGQRSVRLVYVRRYQRRFWLSRRKWRFR